MSEFHWSNETFQVFLSSILDLVADLSEKKHPFVLSIWSMKTPFLKSIQPSIVPSSFSNGFIHFFLDENKETEIETSSNLPDSLSKYPFILALVSNEFAIALIVQSLKKDRFQDESSVIGSFTYDADNVQHFSKEMCPHSLNNKLNLVGTRLYQQNTSFVLEKLDSELRSVEDQLRRMKASNDFFTKVAWEMDVSRLLGKIADGLKEAIHYELFEIIFYNRVKKEIEEKSRFRRNDSKYGGSNLTIELNPSVVKAIYRHRHAVFFENVLKHNAVSNPKLIHITELSKAVILPLVKDRRLQGIIKLFFKGTANITEQDVEWLSDISHQITKSLASANAHEIATRQASNDALTGIANRRLFTEQYNRDFKRFRRFGGEMAVMMIDIDHFKHYNDREGHLQGDLVLKGVAQILSSNIRQTDFLARFGGEEFAVILPGTELKGAGILAQKINQAIAKTPFLNSDKQPNGFISVSIGVSSVINGANSPEDLLHQADMALYYAKENGRNKTFLYAGNGKFISPEHYDEDEKIPTTEKVKTPKTMLKQSTKKT